MKVLVINPENFTYCFKEIYDNICNDSNYKMTNEQDIKYWIENYSGYYNLA
jgi:hypothetical protein